MSYRKLEPRFVEPNERRPIAEELKNDAAVDLILDKPEVRSYASLTFDLSEQEGRELRPERRLAFVVPEEFRNRIVRDVVLRHRKGEKFCVNIGPDRRDPHGAYSRVELHDAKTGEWRGWQDPKGYSSDKFAEPRSANDPENEVLHDWLATVGEIRADAVRITNVGEHPEYGVAQIHGLEIVFFPELEGVEYRERIYCAGTSFIDFEGQRTLPAYGGGSHTEGRYVGAIPLGRTHVLYELGDDPGPNARLEGSQLVLNLEAGKSLIQVEVAVGDTEHLAAVSAKTGRHTRLGYAKLWVGIKRAGTNATNWFIQNANIPPQGVIAGGPLLEQSAIQSGDQLIIEARSDAAYVMGWRIAYRPPETGTKTNETTELPLAA